MEKDIVTTRSIKISDRDASLDYEVCTHPDSDDWIVIKNREIEIPFRIETALVIAGEIIEMYGRGNPTG